MKLLSTSLRNTSHMAQHPHKLETLQLRTEVLKSLPFVSFMCSIIFKFDRLTALISVHLVTRPFCLVPPACKMNITSGFLEIMNEFSYHIFAELTNMNCSTTAVCWLLFYHCGYLLSHNKCSSQFIFLKCRGSGFHITVWNRGLQQKSSRVIGFLEIY